MTILETSLLMKKLTTFATSMKVGCKVMLSSGTPGRSVIFRGATLFPRRGKWGPGLAGKKSKINDSILFFMTEFIADRIIKNSVSRFVRYLSAMQC